MRTIVPAFGPFAKEGAIIGRLVVGYGELEFDLAWCVAWMLGGDRDTAFKVLYRAPGEMQRILMADALVRGKLDIGKTRTLFEQTIANLHVCRKMRNQYAHCNWLADADGLWFVNLEEFASTHHPYELGVLTRHPADLELLQKQEEFFCYVDDCLEFLTYEAQLAVGHIKSSPKPKAPKPVPVPNIYN